MQSRLIRRGVDVWHRSSWVVLTPRIDRLPWALHSGPMEKPIIGYHKDAADDWVAELHCGHFQHVRNNPPWINRPWVETLVGRRNMLGHKLNCVKCDRAEPADILPEEGINE